MSAAPIDIDAVNRDPMLRRTPIGRIFLRRRGDAIAICVDDGIRPARIIDHLDERGVHAALHGKAFWLRAAVKALHQRQMEREAAQAASKAEDLRRERRAELLHFLRRDPRGREVMLRMTGAVQ